MREARAVFFGALAAAAVAGAGIAVCAWWPALASLADLAVLLPER